MSINLEPEDARILLSIEDLRVRIAGVDVVDDVSLSARRAAFSPSSAKAVVVKSLTALSILRLLPGAARMARGDPCWRLRPSTLDGKGLEAVRGNLASMIFQEPVASLNPLMRVGAQVEEALTLHRGVSGAEA